MTAERLPSEVLLSRWGLDASSLADVLGHRASGVRMLLAGVLADDLGTAEGPAEIVALTEGNGTPSRVGLRVGDVPGCPVPVNMWLVPAGLLRDWSGPLLRVVTHPDEMPPVMPGGVAAGLHAVYCQRDLTPGCQMLAEALEGSHVEALPLFVAVTAMHRLRAMARTGSRSADAAVRQYVRALLGAWGCCNPDPDAMLPLFERFGGQIGLPPGVLPSVRRALTQPSDAADGDRAARGLSELAAAEPLLRIGGEVATWPFATRAAVTST